MTKLQISNFKLRQISSYILCLSYPYSSLEAYPFIAIKNVAKNKRNMQRYKYVRCKQFFSSTRDMLCEFQVHKVSVKSLFRWDWKHL